MARIFWAILCIVLINATANAHDANRPDLDKWFEELASGKGLCCSMADGKAITDADWNAEKGHYRVFLENHWVNVPDDAVIKGPNLDGRTIVWPIHTNGEIAVRCFMPGSMT